MENIQLEDATSYNVYLEECRKYILAQISNKAERLRVRPTDFDILCRLGFGAFGKVYLGRYIKTKDLHAMKVIRKGHIIKMKQLTHTLMEKRVLQTVKNPFLMYLIYHAKDNSHIYFFLPFMQGGDLYSYLSKVKTFSEIQTKFYTAQIVLGLEYLHYMDIVYRDLKPENVMIDDTGYVRIADYGFCKQLSKGRTYTICGTPEYMAPEIILMKGYGKSCDWWSLGILLYELSAGGVPFKNLGDHVKLYNSIAKGKYRMIPTFSKELRDLIYNLLEVDFSKRVGCLRRGIADIKDHTFYGGLNWISLFNKQISPPARPPPFDENKTGAIAKVSQASESVEFEEDFSEF